MNHHRSPALFRNALCVAAGAALFGIAGAAGASTFASAILDINNFRITHASGTIYRNTDFSKLVGVNDAHATAMLNNVFASTAATGTRPDVAHQCVGAPCPALGENNFTPFGTSLPAHGNFSYADQNFSGSGISMNGAPAGARSQTRADVATAYNKQFASSNSDVGSSNTMAFRLGSSDTMTVTFDATPYAMAYLSPEGRAITTANARISWSVNIVDLTTGLSVFTFAPNELNGLAAVSRTHGHTGMSLYNAAATTFHLTATSPLLLANRDYQITMQHNTLVSAQQQELPEPGTLALAFTGLAGIAGLRRKALRG
ncbi:putative secreted protein with PEP-CTERM sorting signal [Pseudoduganella lurida]|uniref:Putative secreted protein with PEP-CTERM sorting signal n=1 Tax=Pseudoduganella lurida TaxID=1036180 RepID=A0A562RF70_9BURK|nr:PEP-CTERM sorting domain-containing protein [Pseudoduganella lurida]TWI67691.1 putative secreted protein with PEP-CTERM sorting signal [Pseudoduganella lurida]